MSFRGNLLRAGIDSDGIDVTFYKSAGVVTFAGDVVFEGTIGEAVTDVFIIKNRMSTGTAAGDFLDIDATTYQYSEGMEFRYAVTDWDDTYTLTEFSGMYLRAENREAQAASIYGAIIYGVTNAVDITNVWGALFYGFVKGAAAVTVSRVYGIQTEITWEAGGTQDTLSVEATPILAKVTSGNIDDYTLIHGMIIRIGDMDGGSRLFGSGIKIEDDADMSGTSTFTTGLNIAIGCTTAINIGGAFTTAGINIADITGMQGDAEAGIKIGSWGTPLTTVAAMTDNIRLFQGSAQCVDGPASGYKEVSIFSGEVETDGTHDLTYVDFSPVHVKSTVDRVIGWHYGIQADVFKTGAHNCGDFHAMTAYVDAEDGMDFTCTTRFAAIAGLLSSSGSGTPPVITGDVAAAWFGVRGHMAADAILWLHNQVSASATSGILLELDGSVTYAFDFQGTVSDGWTTATAGTKVEASAEYVLIPVDVKGTTNPLFLLAAQTWTAS